ncbi:MAG: YkgJ family cysteine cluster protein [Bryobacteraceae bacterium]
MLTDLVQIARLGEKKRDENLRLRLRLKRQVVHERQLKRIAEGVEEQIDCTVCANCCKKATVRLQPRDIEKLARHLHLREPEFLREYAQQSDEEGLILRRTEGGCIFLDGTTCTVYDIRVTAAPDVS